MLKVAYCQNVENDNHVKSTKEDLRVLINSLKLEKFLEKHYMSKDEFDDLRKDRILQEIDTVQSVKLYAVQSRLEKLKNSSINENIKKEIIRIERVIDLIDNKRVAKQSSLSKSFFDTQVESVKKLPASLTQPKSSITLDKDGLKATNIEEMYTILGFSDRNYQSETENNNDIAQKDKADDYLSGESTEVNDGNVMQILKSLNFNANSQNVTKNSTNQETDEIFKYEASDPIFDTEDPFREFDGPDRNVNYKLEINIEPQNKYERLDSVKSSSNKILKNINEIDAHAAPDPRLHISSDSFSVDKTANSNKNDTEKVVLNDFKLKNESNDQSEAELNHILEEINSGEKNEPKKIEIVQNSMVPDKVKAEVDNKNNNNNNLSTTKKSKTEPEKRADSNMNELTKDLWAENDQDSKYIEIEKLFSNENGFLFDEHHGI